MSSARAHSMKICSSCHEGAIGSLTRCPRCGAELSEDAGRAGDRLQGMTLDQQYKLLAFIDEGGMGLVYRGERVSPANVVAIKLLKLDQGSEQETTQRFMREANASQLLKHPHVVTVIAGGTSSGRLPFIVAEFLKGTTLADLMELRGQLSLERSLNIFNQLLAGVEAAHRAGVIHRDLKPENVMLLGADSGRDFVKVIDFGIAEIKGEQETRLTRQGEIVGTPAYMSPEQIQGQVVGEESDVYALGVMLFEMLTGARPFQGQSLAETLSGHLFQQPPSVLKRSRHAGLPPELEAVVNKALAKEPQQRYRSVGELRQALFQTFTDRGHQMLTCHACHRSADCVPSEDAGGGLAPEDDYYLDLVLEQEPAPARGGPDDDLNATRSLRPPQKDPTLGPTRGLPAGLDFPPPPGGRQQETEAISRLLRGDQRVLQVVAPAGGGKSTLLNWAGDAATADRMRVHRLGPDPTLAGAPWYPFRSLVTRLLDLPEGRPHTALLAERALRAGLTAGDLPGLQDLLGLPRSGGVPEPGVRFIELICSTVRLLTRGLPLIHQPTLLLFDEVQAYDRGSVHLLQALCEAAAGAPTGVRVLLASDTDPLWGEGDAPVAPAALPPDTVRALLEQRLESTDTAGIQDEWIQRAGADLLLLDQGLRHLQQGGAPQQLAGNLESLVRERLEQLPQQQRRLLQTLAGLGLTAATDFVAALLPEDPPLSELAAALAADGWLVRADAELALTHPTLARMVHDAMDPGQRQDLHRRLLEALQARDASPVVLARHAFEARSLPGALELNEQAGDLARQWLDSDSAGVAFYYRAVQVLRWELAHALEEGPLLDLLLKRVAAEYEVGHTLAASEGLREARALRQWEFPRSEAALLAWEGKLQAGLSGGSDGIEPLSRALELAGTCDDAELALQVLQDLARAQAAAGQQDRALALVTDWIEDGRPGAGHWSLRLLLSTLCERAGAADLALVAAREASRLAREQGSHPGRAQASQRLGALLLKAGDDPAAAADELLQAAELMAQLGDRRSAARCLLLQARACPEDSHAPAVRALSLALQVGWREGAARARRLLEGAAGE